MQLTRFDQQFIRLLVHSPEHQAIIAQKLEHNQFLVSSENPWRRWVKNLAQYCALWLELIAAATKKVPTSLAGDGQAADQERRYYYEENPQLVEARARYLHYHLPGASFQAITYQDRFDSTSSCPGWPGLLFRLGALLLASVFQPSQLSLRYVRIVRTVLLVPNRIPAHAGAEIYLFRIYLFETNFLAARLRERGIYVNLIASTTPLTHYNRFLIGDSLKLCNPYQQDEYPHFQRNYTCRHFELWSPEDIVALAGYYRDKEKPNLSNVIGVYTQGFWLRIQLGIYEENAGKEIAAWEDSLLQIALQMLERHHDLQVIIYPHPLERRHPQKTQQHFGRLLTSHARLRIDFSNQNSTLTFDQVGLGLTTMSTIGFDRLYLGFRTLFFVPPSIFLVNEIPSAYNALFCASPHELAEKIQAVRPMSHAEFMQQTFGQEFWQPARAAEGK